MRETLLVDFIEMATKIYYEDPELFDLLYKEVKIDYMSILFDEEEEMDEY